MYLLPGRKGAMHQQDLDPMQDQPTEFGENVCPKCGAQTESIEPGAEGPPLQQLQLCPKCYLVTWTDQDGLHLRQGVPMGKAVDPTSLGEATLQAGEPEAC